MHKNDRIQKWVQTDPVLYSRLGEDHQANLTHIVEQAGKIDFAKHRRHELASTTHAKPPISKGLARAIVIVLGCMTFSAASGQVAKQTLAGALVIPASIAGGIIGGVLGHEMATIVFTGLLLKNSTAQARRSLHKRQP
jgi:hypothetical protein